MTATDVLLAVCLLVGLASGQGISNSGNDFSIMFPPNLGAVSPNYPPIIFVTTDDPGAVSFTVSYNKRRVGTATTTHTAQKGALTRIELPPGLKDSFVGFSFDSSVNVVAESGKNVIVYALNEDSASTDVFLALPKFETKTKKYNYYGVSVPKSPLEPKPTFGYMALVILEANTVITLTGTVALGGFLSGTPLTKLPGVAYTSRPLAKGTTILLRSADDLTGSKISSNVPVTVITGHQCGFLPGNVTACDHLTEQVPPAETWGFKFILVPLLLQTHDGYKVLASRDGTVVKLTCVNAEGTIAQQDSLNLNDQQFQQLYIPSNQYCTMESNNPILVMQIALSHSFGGTSETDPFMTMVPPVGQYRNDYTLLFVESFSIDTMGDPVIFKPHMSISVPNECFNRDQILFDDKPFPESVQFLEVRCDNGNVCGYEAQYKVPVAQSRGAHTLKHSDSSCSLGVIVYGYERENTYGYPGGMNLDSIAVPNFCFKDDEVKGSEPSGVIKFTLQNSGVAENTCVTFATTDGTATSGVDFTADDSECCFEGGAKEMECEIKVLSDSLNEGEEDLTISLVAKDGQCVCDKSIRATISEALVVEVEFERSSYTVEEDAGFARIALVSSSEAPSNFDVQVSFADGTAADTEDYTSNSITATFEAGQTTAFVDVPIIDDNLFEGNENFEASLSIANEVDGLRLIVGQRDKATVVIEDNEEEVFVNFVPTLYNYTEGAGSAILTFEASRALAKDYTVTVTTSDGSATDPDDYLGGDFEVLFKAGETSALLVVPIVDDTFYEGVTENFIADLSIPEEAGRFGVRVGEDDRATVNIEDDEEEVFVNFVPTLYNYAEGAGSATLTLEASRALSQDYTVIVTTSEGSATDSADYLGGEFEVFFEAGQTTAFAAVPIEDDDEFGEGIETFFGELSISDEASQFGVREGSNLIATVNIEDDDVEPVDDIEVNFSPTSYSVQEIDGYVSLTLVSGAAASFNYTVLVDTSDGSAVDGEDYAGGPLDAFFLAGRTSAQVRIPLNDDKVFEGPEDFTASLSIPFGVTGVVPGRDNEATIDIGDHERMIEVNFSPTEYTVSEDGGEVTIMLTASAPAVHEYMVYVDTADDSATDGSDYTGGRQIATFAQGSTEASVTIPILDDSTPESRESFTTSLSMPEDSARLGVEAGEDDEASVEITDNEIVVNFAPVEYNVAEVDGSVTLTLMSSRSTEFNYTVLVDTIDGSATAEGDFTGGQYRAFFLAGSTSAQVTVMIMDDMILEGPESFTAQLSTPSEEPSIVAGSEDTATVNVEDHEQMVTVNFSPAEYTVSEDGMYVVLMMVASGPATHDFEVTVRTEDATAEDDSDYRGGEFQVRFEQGSSTAELRIQIINDTLPEVRESFTAILSVPEGSPAALLGVQAGEDNQATTEIRDNDKNVVNFSPLAYTISEGDGKVELMLVLTSPATEECTVQVYTRDRNAADGSDYVGGRYNVTFLAGSSSAELEIDILDDDVPEEDERFVAVLEVPQTKTGVEEGVDSRARVTIENDDDEIEVSFDPAEYTVNEEDGTAVLVLKASRPSSVPYTVMVDTQDGSAVEGGDYNAGPYPVVFPAGVTEVNVSIPLVNDDSDECDENFFGHLRIPEEAMSRGVEAGDKATATILLKDQDIFEINFLSSALEVFENESRVEVCLEHSRECIEEFSVQIGNEASANMSASSPDDYQNGPYTVTFPEGSNRGCVEIPVIEDNEEEGPEIFNLEILQPDNPPDESPAFKPGPVAMAQVTIMDGSIDGDPMFTVPLSINKKMLSQFTSKDQQWDLCYEVHGREEKIYNLVSDQCVSVNTHLKLASNPKVGNIMSKVAIVAMDRDGRCHRILADLTGKTLRINDETVKGTWINKGIVVHKLGDRIDVAVPNCQGQRMKFSIQFHYMNGADMIKFTIADGRALSPSSHGLIGQFWNAPVEIQAMKEKKAKTGNLYKVIMYSSFNRPRSFIGEYYPITWDFQKTPCLYAGTRDGSPVLEGKFTEYEVQDLFEVKFTYSQFSMSHCA